MIKAITDFTDYFDLRVFTDGVSFINGMDEPFNLQTFCSEIDQETDFFFICF